MSLDVAILLGILQGLTEFLPVSSSGHLALFGLWFGQHEPDLAFDILVHLATLGAILVYFRKDWAQLARRIFSREPAAGDDFPRHIFWYLLVSMIPAGLVGILLKDRIEWIHAHPFWVGICLLFTGAVLLVGLGLKPARLPFERMGWGMVLVIALAQALAVAPGISRAGMTIMAALFLGLERRAAARFSFLMAVPIIAGAGLLTLIDLFGRSAAIPADLWLAYGAGSLAALFAGFFALKFMMHLLEARRFFWFGFYCLGLGLLATTLSM